MREWFPISLIELQKIIDFQVKKMNNGQKEIWNSISIEPKKWHEDKYGSKGYGFWAVAINNYKVIWYNDIEEGFNISNFSEFGKIDEYWANQDELIWAINKLKHE